MRNICHKISYTLIITLACSVSVMSQMTPWIPVDTMQNTFGTALPNLGPIATSHYSPLVMILHRGKSTYASSSALVYNLSTDNGNTWSRKLPPINTQIGFGARYPTLTLKLDSGQALQTAKAFSTFGHVAAIPEIDQGAALVSDIFNATSTSVAFNQMTGSRLGQLCWASDTENRFFWVGQNPSNGNHTLFRTSDLVNIESFPIINLSDIAGEFIPLQGDSYNGKLYFGFIAAKPGSGTPLVYMPAYVTSTDNGATWSPVNWVDFRQALGAYRFDRLWDYKPNDQFLQLQGDMVVGFDGRVHFALGLQDTNMSVGQNRNAIVEILQTGSYWSAAMVAENLSDISWSKLDGPALGQMGYSVNISAGKSMGVYAVSFVHPPLNNPLDSLCDVYVATRTEGTYYFYPFNLTETPGKNENSHHMSPRISFSSANSEYYARIMYNYPAGYEGYFPNNGGYDTQPSTIYFTNFNIPIPLSPVEFTSFTARSMSRGVVLEWVTATEKNNYLFTVEKNSGEGFFAIGNVKGAGTSTQFNSYNFTDNTPTPGAFYRIKQTDYDGSFAYSQEIETPTDYLYDFKLEQNYPNPFNPSTVIRFSLPVAGTTTLDIYNSLGEKVVTLLNKDLPAGEHQVNFEAGNLSGGVYFCQLRSGTKQQMVKMLLVK